MPSPLTIALMLAVSSYPLPRELKEISRTAAKEMGIKPPPAAKRPLPGLLAGVTSSSSADGGTLSVFERRLEAVSDAREPSLRGAKETEVYRQASPAVTLIVTKESLGSGVLLSDDGRILTNAHVVGDFREVGVIFKPAQEGAEIGEADVRIAKVLKVDQVADLALIQVENVPSGVRPLPLGKIETLPVGADVHAIGHPDGESWTYTRGIVSQVRRNYQWVTQSGLKHEATVVQTQTPINPGNSGGPLLNDAGEVIGINSFGNEGEGLNFAVSADDVRAFLTRPGDRRAQPAQGEKGEANENCAVQVLGSGKSDVVEGTEDLLDLDCDGEPDAIATVPTDPKKGIIVAIDSDGNGKIDRFLVDAERDKHFETEFYDRDEDGEPELVGYVRMGENEPHMWERVSADDPARPKQSSKKN